MEGGIFPVSTTDPLSHGPIRGINIKVYAAYQTYTIKDKIIKF